ncbi:MAG: hypothetical protein GX610_19755 [Rhodococcus sp.]|nr:hypothetical protein [Rhodococcus sp. (in: high G+C Gram-positive bacteria)]
MPKAPPLEDSTRSHVDIGAGRDGRRDRRGPAHHDPDVNSGRDDHNIDNEYNVDAAAAA